MKDTHAILARLDHITRVLTATCETCPFFQQRTCTFSIGQRMQRWFLGMAVCEHHPDLDTHALITRHMAAKWLADQEVR